MDNLAIGIFIGLGISLIGSLLTLGWTSKQVDNTEFEEELERKRKAEQTLNKIKVGR